MDINNTYFLSFGSRTPRSSWKTWRSNLALLQKQSLTHLHMKHMDANTNARNYNYIQTFLPILFSKIKRFPPNTQAGRISDWKRKNTENVLDPGLFYAVLWNALLTAFPSSPGSPYKGEDKILALFRYDQCIMHSLKGRNTMFLWVCKDAYLTHNPVLTPYSLLVMGNTIGIYYCSNMSAANARPLMTHTVMVRCCFFQMEMHWLTENRASNWTIPFTVIYSPAPLQLQQGQAVLVVQVVLLVLSPSA